jgi:hypothetical protein
MAHTTNTLAVTSTAAALHTAGPTSIKVRNSGQSVVYVGPTGAGNQKYPIPAGSSEIFTIGAADVLFAVTDPNTTSTVNIWFI